MKERAHTDRESAEDAERLRRRSADVESERNRQPHTAGMTRRHIDEMSRWLDRRGS